MTTAITANGQPAVHGNCVQERLFSGFLAGEAYGYSYSGVSVGNYKMNVPKTVRVS